MTTAKTFERLLTKSPELATAAGTSEKLVRKILTMAQKDIISRRREPAPPPPEGGISLMAAERKYRVDHTSLSRWRKRGIVVTLLETKNEIYLSEESVKKVAEIYKEFPGRGKRAVIMKLDPNYKK